MTNGAETWPYQEHEKGICTDVAKMMRITRTRRYGKAGRREGFSRSCQKGTLAAVAGQSQGVAWHGINTFMGEDGTVRGWHSDGPWEVRDLNRFACHPFAASCVYCSIGEAWPLSYKEREAGPPQVISRSGSRPKVTQGGFESAVRLRTALPPPPPPASAEKGPSIGKRGKKQEDLIARARVAGDRMMCYQRLCLKDCQRGGHHEFGLVTQHLNVDAERGLTCTHWRRFAAKPLNAGRGALQGCGV